MSLYDDDQIALIDQRIRLHTKQTVSMGSIVSRDTTGPGAMAVMDGATVAVPVKVLGTSPVREGDRVTLELFGTEWLVTGTFSANGFGEANQAVEGLSGATGALTSGSFVDLTEFGSFEFTKNYDATFVRLQVQGSAFATGAIAKVFWALRFTALEGGAGYTPADISVGGMQINTLSAHIGYTSMRRVTNIPAGTYTVQLRWRRASGSGSIFADTNDSYAVEVDERVRSAAPVL